MPRSEGVRQGDTISPKLFTVRLEGIFNKLNKRSKGSECLSNHQFANEIILFSESSRNYSILQILKRKIFNVGLKMNNKKTTVMFNRHAQIEQIDIQGESLKMLSQYVYLGQLVHKNSSLRPEIKRRMRLGWSACGKGNILRYSVPLCLKRKIFSRLLSALYP